jgi:hypothetical protein
MKTTITMREYDTDGNMTRETVTEYDTPPAPPSSCICWLPYTSTETVPRTCPVHGYRGAWPSPTVYPTRTYPYITINGDVAPAAPSVPAASD